jgi:DNA repair protein RadD
VDHARQIAETLTEEHGISADCIFGSTHKDDRARIIEEAKAGELTALVNYGVLTTGFNWPQCDLLAMMRPTQSAALYVQIMGRGMRIADGKEDCLVLDYGENVMRHGPINLVGSNEMKSTKGVGEKKDEEKEQKVCETCRGIVPFSSRICPQCGFVLVVEVDVGEEPEPKDPLSGEATTLSILDFQVKERVSETVDVAFTDYVRHMKLGKPDSMRAIYFCGLRSFSEWICFEHGGGAAARARRWWKEHGGNYPPPETVDDALERIEEIDDPVRIVVREDGKYDKIVRAEFEGGQKPERGIQIPEDDIPF